jgi:hypothetical protein
LQEEAARPGRDDEKEQDQIGTAGERHFAQGAIAGAPGPRLDALARTRSFGETVRGELDRQAAPRPALAEPGAMGEPRIGIRAQAVVDVQREDRDAERRRRMDGSVKERGRVAAAAPGDRDDRCAGGSAGAVSARWCR